MKIPKFIQKQKLQATTRRMPQRVMEAEEEPSIRFSHALVVVVILHLVAIGGVYAFKSIQTHSTIPFETTNGPATSIKPTVPAPAGEESRPQPASLSMSMNAPAGGVYRVKQGETLAKIGSMYGVSAAEIEELNGLKSSSAVHVGQELRIPLKGTAKPVAKKTSDGMTKLTAKDSGETYTVAKGDNPVGIAKKLHVNYDELLTLNKIEDPKKLQIGQKLRIPAKAKAN